MKNNIWGTILMYLLFMGYVLLLPFTLVVVCALFIHCKLKGESFEDFMDPR